MSSLRFFHNDPYIYSPFSNLPYVIPSLLRPEANGLAIFLQGPVELSLGRLITQHHDLISRQKHGIPPWHKLGIPPHQGHHQTGPWPGNGGYLFAFGSASMEDHPLHQDLFTGQSGLFVRILLSQQSVEQLVINRCAVEHIGHQVSGQGTMDSVSR